MTAAAPTYPDDFDAIVIGGGIHGLLSAAALARRGIRTGLLERGTLGSGTTANSLRIIHGGLRYLQQGALPRMRASARAQAAWLERHPDLVRPLRIVVPARSGLRRSRLTFALGFAVARPALAGAASPRLPPPRTLNRVQYRKAVPWDPGGDGGGEWHDAVLTDPAALIARLAADAWNLGVTILEGATVREILRRDGRVRGVRAQLPENPDDRVIGCQAVVNAAGSWIGDLMPEAPELPTHWARGLNLVVRGLPPTTGLAMPSAVADPVLGRRDLFLVPAGPVTLIGTSYRRVSPGLESEEEQAEALRQEWNAAAPGLGIAPEDVIGRHAGLLPLREATSSTRPATLETRARIVDHAGDGARGAFTLVPVKLTMANLLGEQVADRVARVVGKFRPPGRGLRILVLAPHPFFQDRGTPIAVRHLVEFLAARGHTVDVLAYHEGEPVDIPGVRLFRIPRLPLVHGIRPGFSIKKIFCDLAMVVSAWRLARRKRYDLVHAVEESVLMAALLQAARGIPFVYDMDSSLIDQMVEKHPGFRRLRPLLDGWLGRAIRRSRGIVAVCPALADIARQYGRQVALVEDTTLLGEFEQPVEPLAEEGRTARPLILYVGNLEPYQGIDLLLEGFALAARTMAGTLALIGGTPKDIARYRLRAERLGVGERVRFTGPRPLRSLGGYLRQADILVSPRLRGNNTPMKIYSYLDSGVPVLATRLPTHTQVLDHRVALLADPTPAAFADGLIRLAQDPALGARLAFAARELVQREFTPDAARRKLAAFYQDVQRGLTPAGIA